MEEIKLEVWCFLDIFPHIGVINENEKIHKTLAKYIVNMADMSFYHYIDQI